jgi:two-component system, OmpR family, alkaline phosphatase synthesis response regulator PhoP
MRNVLVIEANNAICEFMSMHMSEHSYSLANTIDPENILDEIRIRRTDLIIINIDDNKKNGPDFCKKIRSVDQQTSILMIGESNLEADKLECLENGADDYVTKPFSTREFQARVNSLFRRSDTINKNNTETQQQALIVEPDKRKVIALGKKIDLTPKEFELLILLSKNPGRSYSRSSLLNLVWGYDFNGFEHTVNSHINRLRAKIEPDIHKPKYILTTWGIGYRFTDEININYNFN